MSILVNLIDRAATIITKPIEVIGDWAKEPLKHFEHKRNMQTKEHEIKCEIEAQIGKERIISEIKKAEDEHSVSLYIKKETEVKRVLEEIDEIRHEKQFERMFKLSNMLMEYKEHITKLDKELTKEIASMQIDLRERAYDLICSTQERIRDEQSRRRTEVKSYIKEIMEEFGDNERAMNSAWDESDRVLSSMADTVKKFENELLADIKRLNENIDRMASTGKEIIDQNIMQMHEIAKSDSKMLTSASMQDTKQI